MDSLIIGPYFENIDMKTQIDNQTKFVSALMGGPASYSNDELERKHARLKIDERAFVEMRALLKETLEDFDMDDSDVTAVIGEITSRKRYVVSQN